MIKNRILLTAALVVGIACTSEKVDQTLVEQTTSLQSDVIREMPIELNTVHSQEESMRTTVETITLAAGENLLSVLRRYGISTQQVIALIGELKPWLDLNKLPTGKVIQVTLDEQGSLLTLAIGVRFATIVTATLAEGGWQVTESTLETELVYKHSKVMVDVSLYNSAIYGGVAVEVIQKAIAVLSHRVDFQRTLRDTDVFEVLYQATQLLNPHPLSKRTGHHKVTFIKLTVSGIEHVLYHHEVGQESQGQFYYADGRPVQSFLLKTPLNGARLSSTFGHRKHPILGYTRLHKGLDFGAAVGTPIFAAGDGRVLKASWGGSFGNRVLIQHANGYRSLYAHLQGFAKGIKSGAHVRQGEIIGYLGNTGLSQAPHLHFELHKNGQAINPLMLNTSQYATSKLSGAKLTAFFHTVTRINSQLKSNDVKQTDNSKLVLNHEVKEY
ncbi:M23 family metallopeptidase [Pseudoalteromonas luteoviolacea]|uniref:M23 family metallopeptidase n=1 Tax=Pseudoalteromonas luteoviolacea TaxID=43657 RepID=UPI00068B9CA0|nr:M23 family metallopeptidase [Pseudoalteromonas luteoviolacea]